MRDTNLASTSNIPMGIHLEWWEPPLVKMVRRARLEVASFIEEKARELGIEGFQSSLRKPYEPSEGLWGHHG